MISIILAASDEVKAAALADGFRERTVLVKFDAVQSTEENKRALEGVCFKLKPYQFLVSDYWGMANPD